MSNKNYPSNNPRIQSSIDPHKKKHIKEGLKQRINQEGEDDDVQDKNRQYSRYAEENYVKGKVGAQPNMIQNKNNYYQNDPLVSIDQEEQKSSRHSSHQNQNRRQDQGIKQSNQNKQHLKKQSLSSQEQESSEEKKTYQNQGMPKYQPQKQSKNPSNVQQQPQSIPQQQNESSSSGEDMVLDEDFIEGLFADSPQQEDQEHEEEVYEASSGDDFHDEASESGSDFDDDLTSARRHSARHSRGHNSNRRVIPLEFAKQHIQKIEEDMKRMHERHVKLMREMDENYKLIEQETQEYYIEFLQKWKELAKNKIARYKQQSDELVAEKVLIVKNKDIQIENLNQQKTSLLKDKENIMREYDNDILLRENEKESMKIYYSEELSKKDRDKQALQQRLDQQTQKMKSLEKDLGEIKLQLQQKDDSFEHKINGYEDELNRKIEENKTLEKEYKAKVDNLEQKITQLQAQTNTLSSSTGEKLKINLENIRIIGNSRQRPQNNGQNTQQEGQSDSQQKQNKSKILKKFNIVRPNGMNDLLPSSSIPNSATNNSSIVQPSLQDKEGPINIKNFSTLKQHQQVLQIEELKADQQQVQEQELKKMEEQVEKKYQEILASKKIESDQLHSQLIKYQNDEKERTGATRVKISQQSPMYPVLVKYNQLKAEVIDLKAKKKQELDQLQAQQNKQPQKPAQESSRGSKSMSPRQYQLSKQKQQVTSPSDQSMIAMNADFQKVKEERDTYKKELEIFVTTAKLVDDLNQIIHSKITFENSIKAEIQKLRSHYGQHLTSSEMKALLEKQGQELSQLMDNYNTQALKQQQLAKLIKQYQVDLIALKQRVGQKPEQNSSLNEVSIFSEINQSNVSMMNPAEVSVIEERLKKKLEKEYNESILKLEQQAQESFVQKVRQERKEKNQLSQELQQKAKDFSTLREKYESLGKKYQDLNEVSKKGEDLLTGQVKELQTDQEKLLSKLNNEIIQRKKLHNILEDLKGKIRVYCRVRPLNNYEKDKNAQQIVRVADQFTLKFKMKNEGKAGGSYEQEFSFDSCFGGFSSQDDIFEDTKMLIQSALDGYNVCIFAYGQTGSGKTYTMQGTPQQPGIVPRAIEEVFRLKSKMEGNGHYNVDLECYMVQLYVDNLIDCLGLASNKAKLEIREDPSTGMIAINNTTKFAIKNLSEANNVFEKGIKSRKVFSTEMNEVSSRSHMIFTIIITTVNTETNQRTKSKISFVDLAGSERYDKQNATADRVKEGTKINKSLSELSNVIQRLSSGEQSDHIPYRNNKLTHLMKDSIGGNSKTLMFVNISPADCNSQETKLSLYFGSKIKEIQNPIQKNIESDEIKKLREEINLLKTQLSQVTTNHTIKTSGLHMHQ